MESGLTMRISVVMALPTSQQVIEIDVPAGCSARHAVQQAIADGLDVEHPEFDIDAAPLGVYGIRVDDDAELKEGDRVEIYRALQQDPMELRRKRAASEPGRFSKRRK